MCVRPAVNHLQHHPMRVVGGRGVVDFGAVGGGGGNGWGGGFNGITEIMTGIF